MSDALSVIRAWAQGMAAGQLEVERWHPDAEIVNARGWVVDATYHGREGVQRWWDDIAEAFVDVGLVMVFLEPVGEDRILTKQRIAGRFRSSGIPVDTTWCSIFTVRDGLIARAVGYLSEREAREALV